MITMELAVLDIERFELLTLLLRNYSDLRYVLPREQQFFRIQISRLDEPLSLLGAPAWIRRVHQAALVLHERVQIAPRTRELLAEAVATDLEQLGADSITRAEDFTKDVNEPLFAVQT